MKKFTYFNLIKQELKLLVILFTNDSLFFKFLTEYNPFSANTKSSFKDQNVKQ